MSNSLLAGEFLLSLWRLASFPRYSCAGSITRIRGLCRSLSRDLKHRSQTLRMNSQNSQDNPMSDEMSSNGDWQDSTDDSTKSKGPNSPVASARAIIEGAPLDLILGIICAISVLTSLWLWGKLHDAEKDIQTQVWLRDDALTKFEQGPYADLKAHVLALELNCRK